jgi:hypothetical protein
MNAEARTRNLFARPFAILVLASAVAIPASLAQQAAEPQAAPVAAQQPAQATGKAAQEGFWGRVNPFARKKWVNKRIDPLKDHLSELDEVNARNARDIQDVDGRAQAGIKKAQGSADAANQAANAAGDQAQKANATALAATGRVNQLNSTVSGLDTYKQAGEADVEFRGGQPILSVAARKQLDDLAASLTGRQGYIVEIEAHSPLAGSAGIQSSERLAEAVKRYLVTEHQVPVYRMHSVALGNAKAAGDDSTKPAKTGTVHLRLMENSLAAQGAA